MCTTRGNFAVTCKLFKYHKTTANQITDHSIMIIQLYKVIYNYYLKKDGYNKVLPFLASTILAVLLMVTLIGILSLAALMLNSSFLYIRNFSKGIASILLLIYVFGFNLFFFRILNIPLRGENIDFTFNISPEVVKIVKATIICILIFVFLSIALYITIVKVHG